MATTRRENKILQERWAMSYDHAAAAADTTIKLYKVPAGRTLRIDRVSYVNPTGLVQDPANFANVKVLNGAAIAANWSTQTGQQGTLPANTFVELVQTAANLALAAGTDLSLFLDDSGTGSLPAGRIVIEGRLL